MGLWSYTAKNKKRMELMGKRGVGEGVLVHVSDEKGKTVLVQYEALSGRSFVPI